MASLQTGNHSSAAHHRDQCLLDARARTSKQNLKRRNLSLMDDTEVFLPWPSLVFSIGWITA